jgi:hypothetical protein
LSAGKPIALREVAAPETLSSNGRIEVSASRQVTRHAVHIHSHHLLIQQILVQLKSINPKVIDEIYDQINDDLNSTHIRKTKRQKAFDAQVDAHIAALLSRPKQE